MQRAVALRCDCPWLSRGYNMFEMTAHETYVFILCCIVFTLLTALFSVMFGYLLSLTLKLIRRGIMDEKVLIEYQKQRDKRFSRLAKVGDFLFSALVCVVMLATFAFSLNLKLNEENPSLDIPVLKVVKSDSMSEKHEKNTYLVGLDDQVQTFDLIKVHPVPEASELQLYDIVMYRIDDELVLHRIVKIEEPNRHHPNDYWFTTQGDAVEYPDSGIVRYEQMIGIYRGERTPMVGSFVMFMQSPAGYLCILLVIIGMIAAPILERKLEEAKKERLRVIAATRHFNRCQLVAVERAIYAFCGRNIFGRWMGNIYWHWLKRRLRKI